MNNNIINMNNGGMRPNLCYCSKAFFNVFEINLVFCIHLIKNASNGEIIIICWFTAQETFPIIISVENSCASSHVCENWYFIIFKIIWWIESSKEHLFKILIFCNITFTFTHLADAFIQSDLQLHSGYTFLISMCVPWESNPQPFAPLTQCSTTAPHRNTYICPHCHFWSIVVPSEWGHWPLVVDLMKGSEEPCPLWLIERAKGTECDWENKQHINHYLSIANLHPTTTCRHRSLSPEHSDEP